MIVKIKKLILSDFKGVKEKEYSFSDITKIMAANGLGKTTIATAWYWLTTDKDYGLKSNPNIFPLGVEECLPRVEAVLDLNGKEIIISKQQKISKSKPDSKGVVKTTSANTYEINAVPKTERDFRDYLEIEGIDWELFLPLSHPNVFTGQKAADMRKVLFKMTSEKSDFDIASCEDEATKIYNALPEREQANTSVDEIVKEISDTWDVAELLIQYKLEEIEAMYKASKKKAEQQVKSIPDQIIGLEKAKVDIDTAELELQKSSIKNQIKEKEDMIADSDKAAEDYQKKSQGILELKFKISDIERAATEKLNEEKKAIRDEMQSVEQRFYSAELAHKRAEQKIENHTSEIDYLVRKKTSLQNDWKQTKVKEFGEYSEPPALDENTLICPTCGQALPEELKQQRISDYESRKTQYLKDYETRKKLFESTKSASLERIVQQGNEVVQQIKDLKAEVSVLQEEIEKQKSEKLNANKTRNELTERLNVLPEQVDLSENQEYESLCLQVSKMEEALHGENSQTDYRCALKAEITELQALLDEINAELGKAAHNVKIDEQISDLQVKQRDYEQAKADSEKILYQLGLISKRKNELLVEEINNHFGIVKWVLFDYQKNGEYKEVCVPTVDGKRFGDSTNTGREIIAKLDICNSLQKFFGVSLPVFLDGAESINEENILEMDNQLILLKVTDDRELKVEV